MNGPAFMERSRRGKRHAAQEGRVGILCHAPYGYRYVTKQEGGGEARFELVFDEARMVRAAVCLGGIGTLHHP
jgi:site-specific DNA recombinase